MIYLDTSRLEATILLCFMVQFKLSGLLDWSWWLIPWPVYLSVAIAVLKEVRRWRAGSLNPLKGWKP